MVVKNQHFIKLYSFQKVEVWNILKKEQYFSPKNLFELDPILKEDLSSARGWGFAQAYIWLQKQMIQKNILSLNKQNTQHMVWAWYQWHGKQFKPDKRCQSVKEFCEGPFVMLELEMDPRRVLISDYDAWHHCLNYWFLGTEKQVNDVEHIYKKSVSMYQGKPSENNEFNQLVENSWLTIFDPEKVRELLDFSVAEQSLQATLFDLSIEDVRKVHFFENKRCTAIEKIR